MSLRLLMMGTGTFTLPTFLKLYDTSHQVVGLVTQPDRTGRGHHHHANQMKEAALERGTPVFQPAKANDSHSLQRLREFEADLFVVAAYGQILSAELLGIPRMGAINVHASLLPKYRGAAPIPYAILHGEAETGISIFRIEPKLDAGPILGIVSTPIGEKETAGELEQRLSQLAPPLTIDVIDRLASGTTVEVVQDAGLVTTAPRIRKDQGEIDWSQPPTVVERHVRAMQPWPKPFTFLHRGDAPPQRLLVLDVDLGPVPEGTHQPGALIFCEEGDELYAITGDGALRLNVLQPAGKRAMSTDAFLHGHPIGSGDHLGPESANLEHRTVYRGSD